MDLCAGLLGEVEVVLQQRVLRAVPATGHALAALGAGGAVGADATEVGVGDGFALLALQADLLAEEDADRGHPESVADTHLLGDLLRQFVRRSDGRIGDHAEHPACLLVVGGELVLPVGDVVPGGGVEVVFTGLVEGVGVVQGAAADAGAGEDHGVLEQVDALDAVEAELRGPEKVLEVPGGLREVLVLETASCLDDADGVALLCQAQGGDGSAEAGADDENVIVRGR